MTSCGPLNVEIEPSYPFLELNKELQSIEVSPLLADDLGTYSDA